MLDILNDKEKRDNAIAELNQKEADIFNLAILQTNLKKRYALYNQARILRRIAEECIKWETLTRGY